MSEITTGALYQEWVDINSKLLTQINKQDEIISKQQALIDRLDQPIDTQLTGSIVEEFYESSLTIEPGQSINIIDFKDFRESDFKDFNIFFGLQMGANQDISVEIYWTREKHFRSSSNIYAEYFYSNEYQDFYRLVSSKATPQGVRGITLPKGNPVLQNMKGFLTVMIRNRSDTQTARLNAFKLITRY